MRRPRVRFTIRSLMVLVALVGLVMGTLALKSRARTFRRLAAEHEALAKNYRSAAVLHRVLTESDRRWAEGMEVKREDLQDTLRSMPPGATTLRSDIEAELRFLNDFGGWIKDDKSEVKARFAASNYHTFLHRKYERAASRPWLHVPPDPPPPRR